MQEKQAIGYNGASSDNNAIPQDLAVCIDKFARSFEASARRWELVVYPSLLAFIVLASYGFYLIYTLTNDVGRLARSMETVVVSLENVADKMNVVSSNVAVISDNLDAIATDVGTESVTMNNMVKTMDSINRSMTVMTVPMYQMRNDLGNMSRNVHTATGPMNVMSSILP
jgi:uncharacterized protein YoxC